MAHRRSGAQRRASQKAAQRQRQTESVDFQNDRAQASAQSNRSKPHALTPDAEEVVAAIASLYVDQLKPYGRLLRKRIAERHAARIAEGRSKSVGHESALQDVDMQHLSQVCSDCSQLKVEPEEAGDWSVTLLGCPDNFVDVLSAEDPYPEEFWESTATYFENTVEAEISLPGGRYSCAQALLARDLPFLEDHSLGQVCHIVQLAISQRKILGYMSGSVVPYHRSQSMLKETCAVRQQPAANTSQEAAGLPVATWESARECVRAILEEAAQAEPGLGRGVVPLSNVKRSIRTKFQLELSETTLGHAKLSELLKDARFGDICTVQLGETGYKVVETGPTLCANSLGCIICADDETPESQQEFCLDDPLCLEDGREAIEAPIFGATPGPFGPSPTPSPFMEVTPPLRITEFCSDDPLCLEDARESIEAPLFGPTPGPFGPTPVPSPCVAAPSSMHDHLFLRQLFDQALMGAPNCVTPETSESEASAHVFCAEEPLCMEDANDVTEVPVFGPTPGPFAALPLPPCEVPFGTAANFLENILHRSSFHPGCLPIGNAIQKVFPEQCCESRRSTSVGSMGTSPEIEAGFRSAGEEMVATEVHSHSNTLAQFFIDDAIAAVHAAFLPVVFTNSDLALSKADLNFIEDAERLNVSFDTNSDSNPVTLPEPRMISLADHLLIS